MQGPRSKARDNTAPKRTTEGWGDVALILSVWLSGFNAPARADPNALWRIVHGACVPHFEAGLGPKPCERVDLDGGVDQGVAILKDLVGVS